MSAFGGKAEGSLAESIQVMVLVCAVLALSGTAIGMLLPRPSPDRHNSFNDSTTEAGRDALGYYHERQDEKRSIGLGPEHDWSSHAAEAFGYMAIAYEEPPANSRRIRRPPPP